MSICPQCGTQNPDNYSNCPNCGAQLMQQPAPQPAAPTTGGYIPPAYQQAPPTSVGGWFGWSLLYGFLPLIGAIIMLCTVKDPSAKNYAKLIVIMQAIVIVIYIGLIALLAVGARSLY